MKKKNKSCLSIMLITVLLIVFACLAVSIPVFYSAESSNRADSPALENAWEEISEFANKKQLSVKDWPDELAELLANNAETREFVLNYPLLKDADSEIDLSTYRNCKSVPLFLQWDQRWGYHKYGKEIMGLSGCGPTCLSMVCVYVLNDTEITPRYVAEFAQRNGYYVRGSGSSWTLISEGGPKLGLNVKELPLDKNTVFRKLEAGIPVICAMGPGDFTTTGHFIVMVGCEDGKIKINDPNSILRSEQEWDFDEISSQIKNLWACTSADAY